MVISTFSAWLEWEGSSIEGDSLYDAGVRHALKMSSIAFSKGENVVAVAQERRDLHEHLVLDIRGDSFRTYAKGQVEGYKRVIEAARDYGIK